MATKTTTRTAKTTARKTANGTRPTMKRPAARRVQSPPSQIGRVVRENLHFLFLAVVAVGVGILLYIGYRTATASAVFAVQKVDVGGAKQTDAKAVENLVRAMTAKNGVWQADLDAIRTKLENGEAEQFAWVKSAVVSRVLPDAIRVRLAEREPKAIVRLEQTGKIVWVDDEARILGAVKPSENKFPFVIIGWSDAAANGETATRRNQERVRLFGKLLEEWRARDITGRVTAVDLSDLSEVEILVKQNDSVVPVRVGDRDYTARLEVALPHLETAAANGTLSDIERIINIDGNLIERLKRPDAPPDKTPAKKRRN